MYFSLIFKSYLKKCIEIVYSVFYNICFCICSLYGQTQYIHTLIEIFFLNIRFNNI